MHTYHEHDETIVAEVSERRTPVRWGALFAGLALTTATGWFLMLLGSALGLSVADASDMEAMGKGFGVAATLWVIVSWLIAYFVGALLAARLVGTTDPSRCVMHGITLWGVSLVTAVALASIGVSGLLGVGGAFASAVGDSVKGLVSGTAEGTASLLASGEEDGGTGTGAALATSIRAELKREIASMLAEAPAGGDAVSQEEARAALQEIEGETLQQAAFAVLRGDTEGAKDILAADTQLSEQQIESLVTGVTTTVKAKVDEFQAKLADAVEAASSYTQAVLWAGFLGAALALAASVGGGLLGAATSRRLVAVTIHESVHA